MNERELLSTLMHPFICNLKYAFQDESNLYMATDYIKGGDLSYWLYTKKQKFKESQSQFIIANIIIALEFLHGNGIIHRDVKAENIVFDENGWCSLIDFGLARPWVEQNAQDTSGSPGYCAPEIMYRCNHSFTSDIFGLGVIAHEIMLHKRPYPARDRLSYKEQLDREQVVLKKRHVLENWNLEALDFVNKCIRRDPMSRIGINGIAELKAHVWLKDMDWKAIAKRKGPTPWKPSGGIKVNKKQM